MHARLIADLDGGVHIGEHMFGAHDGGVLGIPRCIGIEIEDVIVLDAVARRAMCQHVPHGLEKSA